MAVPYGVDLAYRARARSVLTALTRLAQTRLYILLAMKLVHCLSVLKTHLSLLTENFFQVENDV